jgi:hypothetical protein
MDRYRESIFRMGSHVTASGAATVNLAYASVAGALAAIGSDRAFAVAFDATPKDAPIRVDLSASVIGADGETGLEDIYVVRKTWLDESKPGVVLSPIATGITWTAGPTDILAVMGGQTDEKWCKNVTLTDTGLALSRTGKPIGIFDASPAEITIFDVAEAVALIRVMRKGTGTSVAPLGARWK